MNDNEIIKALERCGQHRECCYCNSVEECGSKMVLVDNCLDLINRQKAEIAKKDKLLEIADKMQKGLNEQIAKLRAEVDRLNKENERFAYIHKPYIEIHCKDIAQEFAYRLYKKLGVTKNYAIDEVLREMVGDDNA